MAESSSKRSSGSKTRILGIDPGSRVVGFACLEALKDLPVGPKDFKVVAAGVIKPDVNDAMDERLGAIHQMLFELLGDVRPNVVAIEKAFGGVNISSALKLGEARGAIIAAVKRHALPVSEITPAQVKRLVAGSGAATKESVAAAMKALLGFDRGRFPMDVTDALAIAFCHGLTLASTRRVGARSR